MPVVTTAAVAREGADGFSWEPVRLEDPRPGEALVRVVGAGLCHTDLSVLAGRLPVPLPAVLGHEGAGIVEAVGAGVSAFVPGDRALLSFTNCGHCPACVRGRPTACATFFRTNFSAGRQDGSSPISTADGERLGGRFFGQSSLASRAVVDVRSMVKVTAADEDELAMLAPIGCGIQTGAGAILNVLRPEAGASVIVFGAGAVGLSAVMAARLTAAGRIIAVDRVASRLDLALELGATDVIDVTTGSLPDLLAKAGTLTHALETTGAPAVLEQAIGALSSTGVVAVVGAPAAGSRVSFDVNALIEGRTIRGVTEGASDRVTFIPALVDLHRQGRLPIDRLIRAYAPHDLDRAVADARSGATLKPVIRFPREEAR
ncbi:NAD(P)-dependent alcohol dehydrogenase [Actinomadura nitritigenes]|uniref:NAD(P)-dependent alcohol dehydrogenase n=1 Tax=Actinomadura nitritigenes TaxID=134602 RepID=UPI003D8E4CED